VYQFPPIFVSKVCRFGTMLYPARDTLIGRSLDRYGEYCLGEVELFQEFVKPGDLVVEVGANLGVHTVPLARMAGPTGGVVAFEPQPIIFQILCANLALNSILTVVAEQKGLGRRPGVAHIPSLDYGQENNFGGLSLERVTEGVQVPVTMLDTYRLPACSFIKIDAEGMESQVLEGAAQTIDRLRPVLYVENDRRDRSPELIGLLEAMGYRLHWHSTPLFNPDNFAGETENVLGGIVSQNMLCLPREGSFATGLPAVKDASEWPYDD
jgi:FkbM family methyltransferase